MTRAWMIAAVALGGAVGALMRWGLAVGFQRFSSLNFPLGTLAANLIGCFAAGLGYVWLVQRDVHPVMRMGVMVGLLGAMTTFSTWNLESLLLLDDSRYWAAAVNLVGSLALGLFAVWAGMTLAKHI